MSKPKADGVKHIFDELGEQPAQKRTKDNSMNETTSDADTFPPDRPVSIVPRLAGEPPAVAAPAKLILSSRQFVAGFVPPDYIV